MSAQTRERMKNKIKAALDNSQNTVRDPEGARAVLDNVATQIAQAVDEYVQTEVRRIITALNTPGAFTAPPTGGVCLPGTSIVNLSNS